MSAAFAVPIAAQRQSVASMGGEFSKDVIHLTLRGCRSGRLVEHEMDWQALSRIIERMLFWCGGSIHGCRCEGSEMHFAVQTMHAPIASIVRHLVGGYAAYLHRGRGWTGRIFKHYVARTLDAELHLDELVLWLHRPAGDMECWTTDRAYRIPNLLGWVTTHPVLEALGGWNGSGYRRRMSEPQPPAVVKALMHGSAPTQRSVCVDSPLRSDTTAESPDLDSIVRTVAIYAGVSCTEMLSNSRRRRVGQARIIAAVLSTRRGASVADVARLFGRSRSTLIEQAEHHRKIRPQLFAEAEHKLRALLETP